MPQVCTKCKQLKPLDEYYPRPDGVQSRRPTCKACDTVSNLKRRTGKPHGPVPRFTVKERQERDQECKKNYKKTKAGKISAVRSQRIIDLKKFDLTPEDYDRMHIEQNGVCAMCKQPETCTRNGKVKRLAVDHDRKTDIVRGLLCMRCNILLGWLEKIEETGFIIEANIYRGIGE